MSYIRSSLFPRQGDMELVQACYALSAEDITPVYVGLDDCSHEATAIVEAAIRYHNGDRKSAFFNGPTIQELAIRWGCLRWGAASGLIVLEEGDSEIGAAIARKLYPNPSQRVLDKVGGITNNFLFQSMYSPLTEVDDVRTIDPILIDNQTPQLAYLAGLRAVIDASKRAMPD